MKFLLDTHAFLWFILDDAQLSSRARALIVDEQNDIFLSPASYWELAIKISIGKYQLPGPFVPFLHQQIDLNDFTILPITVEHAGKVASLAYCRTSIG
jgi:PIN domain nuclease of toxin-antitoxin system